MNIYIVTEYIENSNFQRLKGFFVVRQAALECREALQKDEIYNENSILKYRVDEVESDLTSTFSIKTGWE